jgi:Cytochrome b5-like Heme/Steroid binding domain.
MDPHHWKIITFLFWSIVKCSSVYGLSVVRTVTSLPTRRTKPTLPNNPSGIIQTSSSVTGGTTSTISGTTHRRTHSSSHSTCLHMMEFQLSSSFSAPTLLTVAAVTSGMIYVSSVIQKDRETKRKYAEYEAQAKAIQEEKARKAFIQPKDFWNEEELKQYDGTLDPEGPILMAVNGKVFNVYKGRHFYGPGCEYHIFAGRDATRLLAKGKLEEETLEEKTKDLNMAEKATLQGWMWTFESKYEVVGKLEGFDERSTSTRTILSN